MTILEKFMEEHPVTDTEAVVYFTCPQDFGFEKPAMPCPALDETNESACRACWGREYQEGGGNGA